jgi:pimeloyl-ACP methyl ester carboxylesterase
VRRLVAAAALALLVAPLAAGGPAASPLVETCATSAERRAVVRFRAADGARLVGVRLGRGTRGVVLAHQGGGGAPANLCAWLPYARTLAARGYRVLVFDHRGHGSSPRSAQPGRIDDDVAGAAAELRRRGARTVVLVGASLGGSASIAAATRIQPPVAGVVSLSAPLRWGRVDALAAAARLELPALFVAAERDGSFGNDARELFQVCAADDKQLEVVAGSGHGAPLLRRREVRRLVDAWIAERSG